MAQVSRAIKQAFLQACPPRLRSGLLNSYPNLRKAAPKGLCFVYPDYYSGIAVNIDTRYKVERIMWSGRYEPPLCAFLESRDTAGWVCLDIGANVGAIALVLAKRCGPHGRVYAFEPGPPNLARLRENLKLNPELAARCEVIAAGVGDCPGELWWAEEKGNPGNALLTSAGTDRVRVLTVDDFVRECSVNRIDLIKIDVEGMETQSHARRARYLATPAPYSLLRDPPALHKLRGRSQLRRDERVSGRRVRLRPLPHRPRRNAASGRRSRPRRLHGRDARGQRLVKEQIIQLRLSSGHLRLVAQIFTLSFLTVPHICPLLADVG